MLWISIDQIEIHYSKAPTKVHVDRRVRDADAEMRSSCIRTLPQFLNVVYHVKSGHNVAITIRKKPATDSSGPSSARPESCSFFVGKPSRARDLHHSAPNRVDCVWKVHNHDL